MTTRGRWRTLDTAFGAVNRPTEERSYLASRSAKRPDLGAAYSETVRRITHCSILLAEKGGAEDQTSGSPTPPGRESARGK